MIELAINIVILLAGAIIEHESNGKLTQVILYNDDNKTIIECKGEK